MTDTILLARSVGDDSLVHVERRSLLHHTLVVGQSGSGKSFFVARLLEEVLLRSRARVILIDSNGDYRHLRDPALDSWQTFATSFRLYSTAARDLGVPDYDRQALFCAAWKRVPHRTLIAAPAAVKELTDDNNVVYERRLFMHWCDLRADEQDAILNLRIFAPEIVQALNELRIHLRNKELDDLIRAVDTLYRGEPGPDPAIAHKVYAALARQSWDPSNWLALRFHLDSIRTRHNALWYSPTFATEPTSMSTYLVQAFHPLLRAKPDSWRYLALVLDAIEPNDVLLTVDVALSAIWHSARNAALDTAENQADFSTPRYPYFIVLDEAHNFVPREPRGELQERVADRIFQIASEGRKYGLYLILATQRPSKLHPALVPECENSAILRLQSPDEIAFARDKLGTDPALSASLPRFRQGRAVIHGQWSENASDVMIAPARTTLGGVGLGSDWLASPFHDASPSVRTSKGRQR